MKFKKESFFKRLWRKFFVKEPIETEYIGCWDFSYVNIFTGTEYFEKHPLYKETNKLTGEIRRIYAINGSGDKINIDVNAFLKHGRVVIIGL